MKKEFKALGNLEECAEGMKDLPKSNWIDLAEDEAELDLKIMDWVDTIREALTELKAIKKSNPNEALKQVTYLSAILPDWQRVNNGVDSLNIIKQALQQSEIDKDVLEKLEFNNGAIMVGIEYKGKKIVALPLEEYNEFEDDSKKANAFDIIKEKIVDMETLKNAIFRERAKQVKSGLQWYNNQVKFHSNKYLTEEEFNLLKEVEEQ